MSEIRARTTGLVLTFPAPASRPPRPPIAPDEARGTVLLFTGIRYERQVDECRPRQGDGARRRRRGR